MFVLWKLCTDSLQLFNSQLNPFFKTSISYSKLQQRQVQGDFTGY